MPLLTQAARVFEIVASSGSIRKASERVNLAPSAINRQVLNLEAEMGMPLFTRHARGMNLTEAGKLLVESIRAWQVQEEFLRNQVEMLKGRTGHVRLGIMECLAQGFLSSVYQKLTERCGNVAVDLVVAGTTELADRMLAGDLDLAVAFNMPGDLGFRSLYETRLDIGIAMKPNDAFAAHRRLQKSDLQGVQVILADRSLTIEPIVKAMMEQMGLVSKAIARSNSVAAIKGLVAQGAGISFLTWADVREEVGRGELMFLPVENRRMHELLSVSGRNPAQMSETARALTDILVKELQAMGSGSPDWFS
jgi:DNA-binding transcriptional LysR family regulator